MSGFVSKKENLREAILLLFYFNLKKSTAESYRLLVEAYGEHALLKLAEIGLEDSKRF